MALKEKLQSLLDRIEDERFQKALSVAHLDSFDVARIITDKEKDR